MFDPPASAMDSRLIRDMFADAEMREIFSDEAVLAGWLAAEAALAEVQADAGIIPSEAAETIAEAANIGTFDLDWLRERMGATGHPLVATIDALGNLCGEAGRFVHFGATTQDIIDTGAVLQMRDGLELIGRQLAALLSAGEKLAATHKHTVMAARTHGQHAVPTTLGYKIAVIVAEFRRHRDRLRQLEPRLLVVSLSGAAGTLATLGDDAEAVRNGMAEQLGLAFPDAAWHTARDALAECVFVLALMTATAAKLANEVINLQRSEIAELAEPAGEDAVGSSTMPQKRNPMTAQQIVATARLIKRQPAAMLEAMQHEHERDFSAWTMEWAVVPETFIMTSAVLQQTARVLAGLHVDPERMRANLALSGGLLNAEAVMMKLAPAIGRDAAHHLVAELTAEALQGSRSFVDVLSGNETVSQHLTQDDIRAALEPEGWLGEAVRETERILDEK